MLLPNVVPGSAPALPLPAALRAGAVVLFSIAGFVVALHATLLALAAPRAPGIRRPALVPLLGGAFLAVWLALAVVIADGGNFPLAGGVPERVGLGLVLMTAAIAAGFALLAWSRTVRAVNDAMPPEWLVWAQSYRALGFIFVVPYLQFGVLPAGFAWPAAIGDTITGVAAIFVGRWLMRRGPHAMGWATAWNLFGLLDLVVAPVAALHAGARVLALYPLAIVPLFAGPPIGILTHVYSLRNLRRTARSGGSAIASRPRATRDSAAPPRTSTAAA